MNQMKDFVLKNRVLVIVIVAVVAIFFGWKYMSNPERIFSGQQFYWVDYSDKPTDYASMDKSQKYTFKKNHTLKVDSNSGDAFVDSFNDSITAKWQVKNNKIEMIVDDQAMPINPKPVGTVNGHKMYRMPGVGSSDDPDGGYLVAK